MSLLEQQYHRIINMNEEWKDFPGYEDKYKISNLGRVLNITNNKIRKGSIDGRGYPFVIFMKNGKRKVMRIHRKEMEAFFGKSELEVNHKDGNKHNNNLDNLEYVTRSQNCIHSYLNGFSKGNIGSKNGISKLKECEVFEIRRLSKFLTPKFISKMFKMSPSRTRSIIRGDGWKHVPILAESDPVTN